jgi:hypothetical protein
MSFSLDRRDFLKQIAWGTGVFALSSAGLPLSFFVQAQEKKSQSPLPYQGPNIFILRFGGGVRRLETIHSASTYAPFFCKTLVPEGTLYRQMEIAQSEDNQTSHGEGTLRLLTGKYEKYEDQSGRFLGAQFEAKVPTLFEYLRKQYEIPEYQTLMINGEDRKDEEFYSFSNHPHFGLQYRSNVLSLYRFKVYLLREQLKMKGIPENEWIEKQKQLKDLEAFDYRLLNTQGQSPEIENFWKSWKEFYGETGYVNPRGDRLLTELTLWAMRLLRPRLLIVNYNDPDYVHWGYPSHYTEGIKIIDKGIELLYQAVQHDEFYRGNTIFAIVPDCGRDNNRFMEVPYQHHFNSRSAREIFAFFYGTGIGKNRVIDRVTQQIDVAPTLGKLMGVSTPHTEGSVLEEVFV